MEIFKEHVVEIIILVSRDIELVVSVRNVTHFIQILRSNLTDMQIDEICIVSVYLE
jgi:hypothetical protein